MRVLVTPTFERAVKKLHKQQKAALDEAVRTIVGQPEAGETKVGDLAGVQVGQSATVQAVAYRIVGIEPDGTGISTVRLERA